ncbi:MAG: NAD(P)/FAD-dependent oxidoreductase, partial [Thermodesulfobacteriota bacterium]
MSVEQNDALHHVVIIGGGFGGLYAAKKLGNAPARVTLIDKRNFHLFQPLLYQVATGGLSPGDIASPLRGVLQDYENISVLYAEVVDINADEGKIILSDGEVAYDTLIVATGTSHHYFGHDEWAQLAPGLKTVEDALEMRRRILLAFEAAEREPDPWKRHALMTFIIVGGGPTGVELAGAMGELSRGTLRNNFRNINPAEAKILLIEGLDRVLPTYPPDLSAKAETKLKKLGVDVRTNTMVTDIKGDSATVRSRDHIEKFHARTILWTAGVKASFMGEVLARRTGAKLDRGGKVSVQPDLTIAEHQNIFVIGDLSNFSHQNGKPLPGTAPVAMQQGQYAAGVIRRRLEGQNAPPFRYRNKGNLAVIGRNAAVADLGFFRFYGFFAWLIWIFVHIRYLIEF